MEYSPELGEEICKYVSSGITVSALCEALRINHNQLYKWLDSQPEFAQDYDRAKQVSSDFLVEEMKLLADDETLDPRSRQIRIETRKWIAGKLKPRKWGEKTVVSNDPDSPIGSLALRLDTAINGKIIDITPEPAQISHLPANNDCSDLV